MRQLFLLSATTLTISLSATSWAADPSKTNNASARESLDLSAPAPQPKSITPPAPPQVQNARNAPLFPTGGNIHIPLSEVELKKGVTAEQFVAKARAAFAAHDKNNNKTLSSDEVFVAPKMPPMPEAMNPVEPLQPPPAPAADMHPAATPKAAPAPDVSPPPPAEMPHMPDPAMLPQIQPPKR